MREKAQFVKLNYNQSPPSLQDYQLLRQDILQQLIGKKIKLSYTVLSLYL